jgi:streptomycin 6-kinase
MPTTFRQNIVDIFGELGEDWLSSLSTLTQVLAQQYQLTDLQPVENMSFNYVMSGFKDEKPIILKLGLNKTAIALEVSCLNAFANHGAPEVIAHEPGMVLMERATPGTTLKTYFPNQEKQAIDIFCKSLKRLHASTIPLQHDFQPLKSLLLVLDEDVNIPTHQLSTARQLRDNLLNSTNKNVLLHGDLHHENILINDNGWLVIDPKGFIGDPAFDVCAFIHNPIPELLEQAKPLDIINKRVQLCANVLNFSAQRIQDWLYIKSILGWMWCLEDNLSIDYFKAATDLLYQTLLPNQKRKK